MRRRSCPDGCTNYAARSFPQPLKKILFTDDIFKHDQPRPLGELSAQLAKQGLYKDFPPAGVEVVSRYVAMGIGWALGINVLGDASQCGRIRVTLARYA